MAKWLKRAKSAVLKTAVVDGLYLDHIHSMDSTGTVAGVIEFVGHRMFIDPWWSDCGVTGENIRCSCGFVSQQFSGYGAWQVGLDGPPEDHQFDALHAAMYEAAQEYGRGLEVL